jgi:hypothetical protein
MIKGVHAQGAGAPGWLYKSAYGCHVDLPFLKFLPLLFACPGLCRGYFHPGQRAGPTHLELTINKTGFILSQVKRDDRRRFCHGWPNR